MQQILRKTSHLLKGLFFLFALNLAFAATPPANTDGQSREDGSGGSNPPALELTGPGEACVGEEKQYVATLTGATDNSFEWEVVTPSGATETPPAGNITQNGTNSTLSYTFAEIGVYEIRVTAAGLTDELQVFVQDEIRLDVSKKTICIGEETVVTATACDTEQIIPGLELEWDFNPNGHLSGTGYNPLYLTGEKPGVVTITATRESTGTTSAPVQITILELEKIACGPIKYNYTTGIASVPLTAVFNPNKEHDAEWKTAHADAYFDAALTKKTHTGPTATLYMKIGLVKKDIVVKATCGSVTVSKTIQLLPALDFVVGVEYPAMCIGQKMYAAAYQRNLLTNRLRPVKAVWTEAFGGKAKFPPLYAGEPLERIEITALEKADAVTVTGTYNGSSDNASFKIIGEPEISGDEFLCVGTEGEIEVTVCEEGRYMLGSLDGKVSVDGFGTAIFVVDKPQTIKFTIKGLKKGSDEIVLRDPDNKIIATHKVTVYEDDALVGPTALCINETRQLTAILCDEADYTVTLDPGLLFPGGLSTVNLQGPGIYRLYVTGTIVGTHKAELKKNNESVDSINIDVVDGIILEGPDEYCFDTDVKDHILYYCVKICDPTLPAPTVELNNLNGAPLKPHVPAATGVPLTITAPETTANGITYQVYVFTLEATGEGENEVTAKAGGKTSNKITTKVDLSPYESFNKDKGEKWIDLKEPIDILEAPQTKTVTIELKPRAGATVEPEIEWQLVIRYSGGQCDTPSKPPVRLDNGTFNSIANIAAAGKECTLTYTTDYRYSYTVEARYKCGDGEMVKGHQVYFIAGGEFGKTLTPFAPSSKYRNVDIHGQPTTAGRPQQGAENDQPGSKFSIDTYSMAATYSVTDISIPLQGSDLSLEFRRTNSVDTYIDDLCSFEFTVDPWKSIMGYGWKTNLTAHIDVDSKGYTVFDENGAAYRYDEFFRPIKDSFSNHDSQKHKLEKDQLSDDLIWTKQFGTVYRFSFYKVRSLLDRVAAQSSFGSGTCSRLFRQLNATSGRGTNLMNPTNIYRLEKVTDRNDNSLIYEYTQNLLPTKVYYEQQPELFIEYTYDDSGSRLQAVEDPLGRVTTFTYNDQGLLEKVTAPAVPVASGSSPKSTATVSPETSFTYQVLSSFVTTNVKTFVCLNSVTDAEGNKVTLNYDVYNNGSQAANAHLTEIITPDNGGGSPIDGTATFTFSDRADGRDTTVTDTRGNTWSYAFNTTETNIALLPISAPNAETQFTEFALDEFSRTLTPAGGGTPLTMNVKFALDTDSGTLNLSEVTDYWGIKCSYTYGSQGVSYFKDGVATSGTYNFSLYGQPYQETIDAGGLNITKTFGYDPEFSQMVRIVDARGLVTTYDIDAKGNRIAEYAPENKTTTFEYNAFGFQTKATDADGRTTSTNRVYSPTGWVDTTTVSGYTTELSITTSKTCDLVGNVIQTTDANGNITTNTYDAMNGLAMTTLPAVFNYDTGTNTNPVILVHRDKNRQVVGKQDARGNWTLTEYDAMLRPISTTVEVSANTAANIVTSTSYDLTGNKSSFTDARGVNYTFTYDAFNNLISEVRDAGGLNYTSTYTYGNHSGNDLFGDTGFVPTEKTDARGIVTKLEYDNAYRLIKTYRGFTGKEVLLSEINYDPAGNVTKTVTYNNLISDATLTGDYIADTESIVSGNQETVTVYDDLNRPTQTAIDLDGDGASVTDPDDIVTSTFYDLTGNVITVTDAEGHSTQTEYDGAGRVSKTVVNLDDNAQVQTISGNNFAILAHADDIVTEKVYDDNSNVLQEIIHNDTAGAVGDQIVTKTYDALNRPVTVTDPENFVSETQYDLNNNVRYVKNGRGFESITEYDEANRAFKQTMPQVFDAEDNANENPMVITFYDTNSNVVKTIDARGLESTNVYDALNRVTESRQIVDANDNSKDIVSLISYDENNNQIQTTFKRDDVDLISSTTYDSLDRPLTTTDAEGYTSVVLCDLVGNKVKLFDNRSNTDVNENIAATPQMRYFTKVIFDRANRMVENHLPSIPHYTRTAGVLSAEINGSPFSTVTYLKNNWITKTTDLNGNDTTTTYDNAGRKLKITSAIGQETSYVYDKASNVLTQTVKNDLVSGGDQVTGYAYDKRNLLLTETLNPGHATLERVYTYTYDENGNKKTRIFPNADATTYNYDALDRLTSEVYTNAAVENRTYSYNNNGAVVIATDATGSTEYEYDILGRQVKETKKDGSGVVQSIVESIYDKANNRIRCFFPSDKKTLKSAYDKRNLLTTMTAFHGKVQLADEGTYTGTPEITTYAYNGNSQQISCTLPNTQVTTKTFDQADRILTSTTQANSLDIYTVTYKRDPVGNQLQTIETRHGQAADRTLNFVYDDVYRLTEEHDDLSGDNLKTVYVFDLQGNRLTKTQSESNGTVKELWSYTNDLLNRTAQVTKEDYSVHTKTYDYTYDVNGNRLTKQITDVATTTVEEDHTYIYDQENRLDQVDSAGGTVFKAEYDYRTRRMVKEEGAVGSLTKTDYVYDGGVSCQEIEAGNLVKQYIRGNGMGGGIGSVLYMERAADVTSASTAIQNYYSGLGYTDLVPEYYAYNAVGSVVANTDQDGLVIRENDFDAYGNQVREQDWTSNNFPTQFGGSSNDLLFSTKERDTSIGLDCFGFRYYDAVLGKWTTRDPAGYPDGTNNQLYVNNNPINLIDPLGLAALELREKFDEMNEERNEKLIQFNESQKQQERLKEERSELYMELVKEGGSPFPSDWDSKTFEKWKKFKNKEAQFRKKYKESQRQLAIITGKMNRLADYINDAEAYEKQRYGFVSSTRDITEQYNHIQSLEGGIQETTIEIMDTVSTVSGIKAGIELGLKLSTAALRLTRAARAAGARGAANNANQSHGFSVRDINPLKGDKNCGECSIAVDEMLAGKAYKSAPITKEMGIDVLAKRVGKKTINWLNRNQKQVINMMKKYGHKSRGIIYASYKDAQGKIRHHYFNVVNQRGTIRFLDGQIGGPPDLSKYTIERFIRTDK